MEWGEGVSPSWYYPYTLKVTAEGETPPPHSTQRK